MLTQNQPAPSTGLRGGVVSGEADPDDDMGHQGCPSIGSAAKEEFETQMQADARKARGWDQAE